MTRPIEQGDHVRVVYSDGGWYSGQVWHTPSDIGDMWYIEVEGHATASIRGKMVAQNPQDSNLSRIELLQKGKWDYIENQPVKEEEER